MSDPWQIYDELIEAVPAEVTITTASAGLRWCQVTSSEDGLGMAYTLDVQSRPAGYQGSTFAGAALRDVAALAKSWNFAEAGIGMAALNAFYAQPERARTNGFTPCRANNWQQVFHPYSDDVAGKKVAVIGHFPFAPKPLEKAAELRVLERSPFPGDYPDSACEYLLADSDYVFISSSAFVNKTMPRLLELARDATTVILGPSTPLSPLLFDHGVDVMTGFVSPSPARLADTLGSIASTGMYDHGYRVEQRRP